jgi:hypothetical protein
VGYVVRVTGIKIPLNQSCHQITSIHLLVYHTKGNFVKDKVQKIVANATVSRATILVFLGSRLRLPRF